MGRCIEKIPCPSCGSSDALQVFQEEDGSYNGLCFACNRYYHDPYNGSVGEKEVVCISSSIDPTKLPEGSIPERKIRLESSQEYGVRVAYSEEDGRTVVKSYYPDTKEGVVTGWEERDHVSKKFLSIGDRKGSVELWGTNVAKRNNGKKLFITEGRLDTLSLYQAILDHTSTKWAHLKPSVVSLTRGAAGAVKDLVNNREFVESFDEVILVFDNDEAGKKAVRDVTKTFPLFKSVELPLKDANDMVMGGRGKELYDKAMWGAQVVRQAEVVDVSDVIEDALIRPEIGVPTPWPAVNKLTYGLRPHTIHILGAGVKAGKTDHEYQLIHHLVLNEGQKVGIFDLENPPQKTVKKIASKEAGKDFTKPDCEYEDDELRGQLQKLDGKIRMYDRGASRDWADIRAAMTEMFLLDDIKFFFIDPLTALVSRYSASEANDILNEISTDIADLVYKYPITLFCYSHVNPKPKGAKTHEQGGRILTGEFTGSRGMERYFHYAWGIRRDRSPECPLKEQDVSYLDLLFDRDFGNSGTVKLFYNKGNVSYLEMGNQGRLK
jgi:twinkle protein